MLDSESIYFNVHWFALSLSILEFELLCVFPIVHIASINFLYFPLETIVLFMYRYEGKCTQKKHNLCKLIIHSIYHTPFILVD